MNTMLGLWGPAADAWSMIERLPEPGSDTSEDLEPDGLLARAIDNSLMLGATRYRMEALADRLGLEKSQRLLPSFEAGVVGERDAGESDWLVGPMIALPIPLFDQGQGEIAKATAEVRRIQAQYYDQAVQVRAAVRAAYARLESAKAKVTYYQQVMLPLQQQIVDETQLQYNAMQVGGFQLLQARQMQIETGSRYLDALNEYWRSHAMLTAVVSGGSAELDLSTTAPIRSAPAMTGGGH